MVLSDYLSKQLGDKRDPHQIIPISFNIKEVLKESCQNNAKATFMVQTRLQSTGVKAPMAKRSPNSTNKRVQEIKPIITDNEQDAPDTVKTNYPTSTDVKLHTKHLQNQTYPQPIIRPTPRPQDLSVQTPKVNTGIEPNLDFEENSPHQEGTITETYESPDKSYLEQPKELTGLVHSTKLIHKYLPKQVDIDRIMGIIKRKVLKGTQLPLTIKEIQVGYLSSSFFKDLYMYMAQNKLPSKKSAIHKVLALAQNYVLLNQLLFKLITVPDREKALLAITESCTDKIIMLYHNSLFAGHQGVIKTHLTMSSKFFILNLMY